MVPPLEGFWWQDGVIGVDYTHKDSFRWISVIRLPDFVTKDDFDWAVKEAAAKKKQDFSKVEFFTYDEGLCVQCMHIGAYDDEPATVAAMHRFMEEQGYALDMCVQCMHIGAYDDEPATVAAMHRFMEEQGYALDITDERMHHEIYLSDARKAAPEKLRTVIRHPIKVKEN